MFDSMFNMLNSLATPQRLFVEAALSACLLAVLVLVVCRAGDKWLRPQWKLALWVIVAFRFLVPVLPQSSLSVFSLVPSKESRIPAEVESNYKVEVSPSVATETEFIEDSKVENSTIVKEGTPTASKPTAPNEAVSWSSSVFDALTAWRMIDIAAIVWLTGTMVLLARLSLAAIRLMRRSVSWSENWDPKLQRLWNQCRDQTGVRRAKLRLADDISGPATTGFLRPVVVLPKDWSKKLTQEDIRHVLLHELMHVRRGDILFQLLGEITAAIHWFNPIAWIVARQIRNEVELACDDRVLGLLARDERSLYGHTVLNVVDRFLNTPSVTTVGFGEHRSLDNRISRIANYRGNSARFRLSGFVVVGLFVVCCLTSANPGIDAEPDNGGNTYAGTVSFEGKPIEGAEVRLLRIDMVQSSTDEESITTTNEKGEFRFEKVPEVDSESTVLGIVATKKGRASTVWGYITPDTLAQLKTIQLPPAATIKGRTVDVKGNPIAGVDVWLHGLTSSLPVEGVTHTKSAADGTFEIKDAHPWEPGPPVEVGDGVWEQAGAAMFFASKKGFAIARPQYDRSPKDVGDVVLEPEAAITGRVMEDGRPVAGIRVSMQSRSGMGWKETVTNKNGHYRLDGLGAGRCNIWANPGKDKTCIAVDSLKTAIGKTVNAPDIEITPGGWIEGMIIGKNGVRITPKTDGKIYIGLHGPSRPKSGAAVESVKLEDDGTFRMRVPPGKNYPYVMSMQGPRTKLVNGDTGEPYRNMEVPVGLGETKRVTFIRLEKNQPDPLPKRDDVVLPLPVEEEREIAAKIRDFGGWYKLNSEKVIEEVNMVYHNDDKGKRHDNPQRLRDGILEHVSKLEHLTSLFMCDRQATDATMHHVKKLKKLHTFYIWDAKGVTDEGVKHLAGLEELKSIHISEGKIGDGALEVFSKLPKIERLSIQKNNFSDEGIDHLCRALTLKSIVMGLGESRFSDEAVRRLLVLPNLHTLGVQNSKLTPETVKMIKDANVKFFGER